MRVLSELTPLEFIACAVAASILIALLICAVVAAVIEVIRAVRRRRATVIERFIDAHHLALVSVWRDEWRCSCGDNDYDPGENHDQHNAHVMDKIKRMRTGKKR